jgi:hypothetical protein
MTQALYAHMNNKRKMKKKKSSQQGTLSWDPSQLWELYSLLFFFLNKLSHFTQKKKKSLQQGWEYRRVVECFPSMSKALSSIPSITKKI